MTFLTTLSQLFRPLPLSPRILFVLDLIFGQPPFIYSFVILPYRCHAT